MMPRSMPCMAIKRNKAKRHKSNHKTTPSPPTVVPTMLARAATAAPASLYINKHSPTPIRSMAQKPNPMLCKTISTAGSAPSRVRFKNAIDVKPKMAR